VQPVREEWAGQILYHEAGSQLTVWPPAHSGLSARTFDVTRHQLIALGIVCSFTSFRSTRYVSKKQCFISDSRIWFLFDPWTRDQDWVKKSGSASGSGMNNPDLQEKFFWVKILNFFDADPGSGMGKIQIYPG
jgi:hypothetical protein